MTEGNPQVPLELAELLHATLGPLNEVLREEDHPWSPLIDRVLKLYEDSRNAHLSEVHGGNASDVAAAATVSGVNLVEALVDDAEVDRDFMLWDREIGDVEEAAHEQSE